MKKLNVAIIGQGRSGRDIHGAYFLSEANKLFNVVAVVDQIEFRRERAKKTLAVMSTAIIKSFLTVMIWTLL